MVLSLLLMLACSTDPIKPAPWPPDTADTGEPTDPGPDAHEYTSYEGTARFQSAFDPDPDARACDIVWGTIGSSRRLCDTCIWAFNINFTLDEEASFDAGGCFDEVESTDWHWGVGLSLEYYGYDVPVLWYFVEDYRYWYPMFVATWDYPNVVWGGGTYGSELEYNGEVYYYSRYWQGSATVY